MSEIQKLAPSEIEQIKAFMSKYADFYKRVESLSNRVEELDVEKSQMLDSITTVAAELESLRIEEAEFQTTLIAKYGEFALNTETFEIQST
jgi:hypothetical protein